MMIFRRKVVVWLAAGCLLIPLGRVAFAQDPVRLPEVTIKAGVGHRITGVVRDTLQSLLDGAEVTIPKLKRRAISKADGTFTFDSLPTGTFDVRAPLELRDRD